MFHLQKIAAVLTKLEVIYTNLNSFLKLLSYFCINVLNNLFCLFIVSQSKTWNPNVDLMKSTTVASSGRLTTPVNNSSKGKICSSILSKTPTRMFGAARHPLRNISNDMKDYRGTSSLLRKLYVICFSTFIICCCFRDYHCC